MKIVFYCAEGAPANSVNYLKLGASGTVSALILAARGLAAMGHRVTVLNRSEDGVYDGVEHRFTDSPERVPEHLAEMGGADVFIANGFASSIFFGTDIKAGKRACWIHNFIDQRPYEDAVKAGRMDYIICISHNQLGTWWRSPVFDRIAQIYNSIDPGAVTEPSCGWAKERKILFIGAPRKSKGFHDALRIFVAFAEKHPGYTFHVAGSASLHGSAEELSDNGVFEKSYEESHLKDLLRDEDGQPRKDIVLHGKIPREEVLRHLSNSMVALQNPGWDSEPEVHSISALEAQAMGVPVMTAFRGGQPEVVVDGETGILMRSGNVAAAVDSLAVLLGDPALRERMGSEARRHVMANFRVETIAREWNDRLEIMEKGGRFRGNLMKALRIKLRHKLRR